MPGLIPDKQPFKNPLELTSLPTTEKTLTVETGIQTEPEQEKVPDEEETTFPGTVPESANEVGSQKFSAKMKEIIALLQKAANEKKRMHLVHRKNSFYQFEATTIVKVLFPNFTSYEKLRADIFLCIKTGNWIDFLKLIKSTFHINGLGQKQIVPGYTSIKDDIDIYRDIYRNQ